jgi:hypothetical protein
MDGLRARVRKLHGQGDRGASTIEFLVFTPLLFLFLLLMVQFAMYFFAQEVAQSAAQAADRTARQEKQHSGSWYRDAVQTGKNRIGSLGGSLLSGARVLPSPDFPNVKVTVTGKVVPVVPWLDLTVSAVSDGPIERFISDTG